MTDNRSDLTMNKDKPMHLDEDEIRFLRLLVLCASPKRFFALSHFSTGQDASGNPYMFLLNRLRLKGKVEIVGNMVNILEVA